MRLLHREMIDAEIGDNMGCILPAGELQQVKQRNSHKNIYIVEPSVRIPHWPDTQFRSAPSAVANSSADQIDPDLHLQTPQRHRIDGPFMWPF